MKTYIVEMRRTSFVNVWVEAENQEEAENKAWKEVENMSYSTYADWEIGFVEEEAA